MVKINKCSQENVRVYLAYELILLYKVRHCNIKLNNLFILIDNVNCSRVKWFGNVDL